MRGRSLSIKIHQTYCRQRVADFPTDAIRPSTATDNSFQRNSIVLLAQFQDDMNFHGSPAALTDSNSTVCLQLILRKSRHVPIPYAAYASSHLIDNGPTSVSRSGQHNCLTVCYPCTSSCVFYLVFPKALS